MQTSYSTPTSATARTFYIWLLSNLGGTGWLLLEFGLEHPIDISVPLAMGVMAALISLVYVPFAIPLFALAQRACTGLRCRLVALAAVVLVFGLANFLLLHLLPLGSLSSVISVSKPYLLAALLAAAWVYRPAAAQRLKARPQVLHLTPVHS